jgi:hypothetical protein
MNQSSLVLGLTRRALCMQNGLTAPTSLYARVAAAPRGLGKTTAIKRFVAEMPEMFPQVQPVYISLRTDADEASRSTLLEMVRARRTQPGPTLLILDEFEELYKQASSHLATLHDQIHGIQKHDELENTVLAACANTSLMPMLLSGGRLSPAAPPPLTGGFYGHWHDFRPDTPFKGIGVGYLEPDMTVDRLSFKPLTNPSIVQVWAKLRHAFITHDQILYRGHVNQLCSGIDEYAIGILRDYGYVIADVSCGHFWNMLRVAPGALRSH